MDDIVNGVIADGQEDLLALFRSTFGEEVKSERMLEFIASIQLYAGKCMRTAMMRYAKLEPPQTAP